MPPNGVCRGRLGIDMDELMVPVTSAKVSIRAWSIRIQSETPTSLPTLPLISSMLATGIEPPASWRYRRSA